MAELIFPHQHVISQAERSRLKGHQPLVLWMTGLSGSGKSTIANALEYRLVHEFAAHTYLLDGDNIRRGLNVDLDFSDADRKENIRRVGEVCKLMLDAGLIVITAFISPFASDRQMVRQLFAEGAFWEVYIACPIEICQQRDPKGLYQKAASGQISNFTGISSPYEPPSSPELTLATDQDDLQACVQQIIDKLIEKHVIKAQE